MKEILNKHNDLKWSCERLKLLFVEEEGEEERVFIVSKEAKNYRLVMKV